MTYLNLRLINSFLFPSIPSLSRLGWNGVAVWKWLANDDKCGICRAPFDGCCADCKVPGDDCPLGKLVNSIPIPVFHWVIITNEKAKAFFDWLIDSLGCLFPLFPHALYYEVARLSATEPSHSTMSHVSSRLGFKIRIAAPLNHPFLPLLPPMSRITAIYLGLQ